VCVCEKERIELHVCFLCLSSVLPPLLRTLASLLPCLFSLSFILFLPCLSFSSFSSNLISLFLTFDVSSCWVTADYFVCVSFSSVTPDLLLQSSTSHSFLYTVQIHVCTSNSTHRTCIHVIIIYTQHEKWLTVCELTGCEKPVYPSVFQTWRQSSVSVPSPWLPLQYSAQDALSPTWLLSKWTTLFSCSHFMLLTLCLFFTFPSFSVLHAPESTWYLSSLCFPPLSLKCDFSRHCSGNCGMALTVYIRVSEGFCLE